MADGINLRLGRRDMSIFRTSDEERQRPVVQVAGRRPDAICPGRLRPSATTNGTGWRDVIDVVRTVVVTARSVSAASSVSSRTASSRALPTPRPRWSRAARRLRGRGHAQPHPDRTV